MKHSFFQFLRYAVAALVLALMSSIFSSAWAAAAPNVSGTVFEDANGDLLADGAVGSASNKGISGVTVQLYKSDGTLRTTAGTTTTDINGAYTFAGVIAGTYYVGVTAPTVNAAGISGLLSEQTYASAGTGNSGTAGGTTGYGTLCVQGTPPTYTDQGGTTINNTAANPANGACYGGRRGATADSSTSLDTREHVTRVVVGIPDITAVNFGFSFNVVSNTNDTGQGSVRQFITNANAIGSTTKAMKFVPAQATNQVNGSNNWWRTTLGSNYPILTASNTTMDGTSYSNQDGSTVLTPASGNLQAAATVGVGSDQATIGPIARPQLELRGPINAGLAIAANPVLEIGTSSNVTVKALSITGGTEGVLVRNNNVQGLLLTGLAVGMDPGGTLGRAIGNTAGVAVSLGYAGSGSCPGYAGITVAISGNVLTSNANVVAGCNLTSLSLGDYVIQNNFFAGNAAASLVAPVSGQSGVATVTANVIVRNNMLTGGTASGLILATTGGGHQIIGNSITGAASNGVTVGAGSTIPSGDITFRGNSVTGNGAAGVSLASSTTANQRIKITQNSFSGNTGNAIDMDANTVSAVTLNGTNCTSAGSSNGGLPRPTLSTATLASATTLTVSGFYCNSGTYTLEFYKVASGAGTGDGSPQAGEGQTYLGSLTGLTGGTFTNQTVSFTSGAFSSGDSLSAIAIRTDGATTAGNTSEFAANLTVASTISGTVFEDTNGDLLADGAVGSASNKGISGATVQLYNAAGTSQGTTTTDTNGAYTFSGVATGTYYVGVTAPTKNAAGTTGLLSEQTYASAGSGNSGTAGTGTAIAANQTAYGSLCVMGTPPTYTDQSATTTSNYAGNPSNGACYGGQRGATVDSNASLNTREHVTRLVVGIANITAADFGFSFNVMTNTNDTGQGSLRQFVANVNANGASSLRFVPALATNQASGGNSWWSYTAVSAFPTITPTVTINGAAYSNADGTTVLNTNTALLGTGGTVGTDAVTLSKLDGPELEINWNAVAAPVLSGANSTVTRIVSYHSSAAWTFNGAGSTLSYSVIGARANAFADPGSTLRDSNAQVINGSSAAGLTISDSLLGYGASCGGCGVVFPAASITLLRNEIRGLGSVGNSNSTTIQTSMGVANTLTMTNNLVADSPEMSIEAYQHPVMVLTNNTFQDSGSATGNAAESMHILTPGKLSVISKNIFKGAGRVNGATGASAPAIAIQSADSQVTVSQNSFSGNGGNAIDLNQNGVNIQTATGGNCPSSGSANGGIPRPTISSASLSGTTLTVSGFVCNTGTYDVEFYKVDTNTSVGDTGSDGKQAGEGATYLGRLSGVTSGAFTNQPVTFTAGAFSSGDSLSAIAIRSDGATTTGNTSEFAANLTVASTISGTVFEDTNGDLLADGAVGSASNKGISGVTVQLYNAAGTSQGTTTTDTNGAYTFSGVAAGTYYVGVTAPTVNAAGTTGLLSEQTYASAGSGNSGTAGTGTAIAANQTAYGSLCVMGTPPTYTDQSATTTSNYAGNPSNGACYGGQRGATADSNASLNAREHVTRLVVGASGITAADFGFSFNVVSNVNTSGQGSLAQFLTNANTIAGANAMRFVPAVASNQSSGANKWWQLGLSVGLPSLNAAAGASTTIDGTAYSNADGTTTLTPNTVTLGDTSTVVGVGGSALAGLAGPSLEINANGNAGFSTNQNSTTIRNLALYGIAPFYGAISASGGTGHLFEKLVLGTRANSFTLIASTTNSDDSITLSGSAAGTIQDSRLGFAGESNIQDASTGNWTFRRNEVRGGSASGSTTGDGINVTGAGGTKTITGNLVVANGERGLDLTPGAAAVMTVSNNTVTGNGFGTNANSPFGILLNSATTTGTVVTGNVVTSNKISGIGIVSAAQQAKVSQNAFGGNTRNAIDLNLDGVTIATATGGNCPSSGAANGGLPRPSLTSAIVSGTTLTVNGFYCNTGTYTLEFYKAVGTGTATGSANDDMGSDNNLAGEGTTYLGSLTGLTGGTFTNQTVTFASGALAFGDSVSAIAIRTDGATTAGNTSEFSANVTAGAIVSGTVFEDTNGDLLADGAVGSASNKGISGVTVQLYNSAGTSQGTTTTDTNGAYTFSGVVAGTYYVGVTAPTVNAAGTTGLLGEQTYASAGSGNSGTAGTGTAIAANQTAYGTLCVLGSPPTYTDQSVSTVNNYAGNPSNGACYGGQRGATVDSNVGLNTREHITRLVVGASSVTGADFGFSFNVVTNVNTSGQGSVAQFIANANTVGGTSTKQMKFVPAVASNKGTAASTSAAWWQVNQASTPLPSITGSNTIVDGRAYSKADGSTQLDYYAGNLEASMTVGVNSDSATIPAVPRPELEITAATGGANSANPVLRVGTSSGVQIRYLSITGGTNGVLLPAGSDNVTGLVIQYNAIGWQPDGTALRAVDNVPAGSGVSFGSVINNSCGTIAGLKAQVLNNALTADHNTVTNCVTGLALNDLVYQGNFLRGTANGSAFVLNTFSTFAVDTSNVVVKNNLITGASSHGVNLYGTDTKATGHQITGNTITANSGRGIFFSQGTAGTSGGKSIIRGNLISSNGSAGVAMAGVSSSVVQQVQISQNSFTGNAGNAIDMDASGVSAVTLNGSNCTTAGISNGGLPRPTVSSAAVSGTTLTVSGYYCNTGTYDIEFYKVASAAAVGDGTPQAGEGETYLGKLSGISGGIFTNQAVTFASGAVANGDSVTAIAIRTDGASTAGNTSEFSANITAAITITGTVFEDANGDLLADGAVGSASNKGINGVTVQLYNSSGVSQGTTTTDSTGAYAFNVSTSGTYYVGVNAPTSNAAGTAGLLGEQTYGSAGSGNAGTAGTGTAIAANATAYGTLCVMGTPPIYTDQSGTTTGNYAGNPSNGACYGGQRGAAVDSSASLNAREHVTRLVVGASNITGADFGFSFNVVSNVNTSGQGSLVQFVANANTIGGFTNKQMKFVPTVASNKGAAASTTAAWWQVSMGATGVPAITANNVQVDGRAYSLADGSTQLDYMQGNLANAATVGVGSDQASISAVAAPELEVNASVGGTFTSRPVFTIGATSGVTLQYLSITGGTEGVLAPSSPITGFNLLFSALGIQPDGVVNAGSYAVSLGVSANSACAGLASSTVRIRSNVLTNAVACNVSADAVGDVLFINNFFQRSFATAIGSVTSSSSRLMVQNNQFAVTAASTTPIVIFGNATGTGHQILGNSVTASSSAGMWVLASGGDMLVRGNQFTNNGSSSSGAGILIDSVSGQNQRIKVTQNSFSGNAGNSIDLNSNGVSTGTGCTADAGLFANGNLGRPAITSSVLIGSTLTLSGTYCNTGSYDIEFYKANGGSGDTGIDGKVAGEGQTYLGTLSGVSGGTFTSQSLSVSGLVIGDSVTAIAIRTDGAGSTAGNTSEFSANATVASSPKVKLSKQFAAGPLSIGGSVALTFTLTNPAGNAAASGVAFTDTLSAGLAVGSGSITNTCGGTLTATAGTNVITLTGAAVAASGVSSTSACTLVVPVTTSATPTVGACPLAANTNGQSNISATSNIDSSVAMTDTCVAVGTGLISGFVFNDGGAPSGGVNSGTPNDGLKNGAEAGLTGIAVALTNCSGTTYASTSTDGSGAYSLIPPGTLASGSAVCVSITPTTGQLATGASVSSTATPSGSAVSVGGVSYTYSRAANQESFNLPGSSVSGMNFGLVQTSTWSSNSILSGNPGTTVRHVHQFTAGTGGRAAFSIASSTASPAASGWSEKLFQNANCDGVLSAADVSTQLSTITVVQGQTVCVVMEEFIPAGSGGSNTAVVQATLTFTNASPALGATFTVQDVTQVGASAIAVSKLVRNVTRGGSFGMSNQAQPGDVLEYKISYANNSTNQVTNVVVNDITPAFTTFVSAIEGSTPTGLTTCMKNTPANPSPAAAVACATGQTAGGSGAVSWRFAGALLPGTSGSVLFTVTVN